MYPSLFHQCPKSRSICPSLFCQCPLPSDLFNVLRELHLEKIYSAMSWIGITVTNGPGLEDLLRMRRETDMADEHKSVEEICVVRPPSNDCRDLFVYEDLPESMRETERQIRIKRQNCTVLCGLYIPPPQSVAKSQFHVVEPDVVDQTLPLPNPLPPFVKHRYCKEEWSPTCLTLYKRCCDEVLRARG